MPCKLERASLLPETEIDINCGFTSHRMEICITRAEYYLRAGANFQSASLLITEIILIQNLEIMEFIAN
jgi:hypothetical protein